MGLIFRQNKYSCCQLVAAINARIYLGLGDISDELFEEMAEIACCKNGSAIQIEKIYQLLNLKAEKYTNGIPSFGWIRHHLPVAVAYHDPQFGYHSALIISVFDTFIRMVNSYKEWMPWVEFLQKLPKHSHQLKFESFTLIIL
jgi:hypothetical protein